MKLKRWIFLCSAVTQVGIAGAALAGNPFSIGISEGSGAPAGPFGWIVAQQIGFEQALTKEVHAVVASPYAVITLASLSFLYGVFHAAGPGHGKAVIASYMIANEEALKRGLVLSFLAALMQGLVAIILVGVLALLFHATAQTLQATAHGVEIMAFAGIALLGVWLVWKKGAALKLYLRGQATPVALPEHNHGHHGHEHGVHDHGHSVHDDHSPQPVNHVHDEHCGHFHAPEPATLGAGFSWKHAVMTVAAAGSRPCSGAILVLVFALSQGIFWAGVTATLAMSLGTAITTGALATMAVLAKNLAVRLTNATGARSEFILRGVEFIAACIVLLVGAGLLVGTIGAGA